MNLVKSSLILKGFDMSGFEGFDMSGFEGFDMSGFEGRGYAPLVIY